MTTSTPRLSDLAPGERAEVERVLLQFDREWTPDSLGDLTSRLPPGVRWRQAVLNEAAKIDQERRQRRRMPPDRGGSGSNPSTKDPLATQTAVNAFGRFRLIRLLGRGGMGVVYLAHDDHLDRDVALKLPSGERAEDPHEAERLLREARAAAHLSHPNICPVYEVGEADGVPYLACQYLDGQPLSAVPKPMAAEQAAEIVAVVARAVGHAHRHGVIHRDLKPGNIMLTTDGRPVVLDFGLSRRVAPVDSPHATMSTPGGTPLYMAPEQVADAHAGPASDQYSLGLVLYELLTGRPPVLPTSVGEVFAQRVQGDVPPPSSVRGGIPPVLEAACLRALAKRPTDRFPSMEAFAEALGTSRHRPVRWLLLAGAALAVVFVAVVAGVWLTWPKGNVPSTPTTTPVIVPRSGRYEPAYKNLKGVDLGLLEQRPKFGGTKVPTGKAEWVAVLSSTAPVDDKLLAIEALGGLSTTEAIPEAIPVLVRMLTTDLSNQHQSVRREAAHLLGYLGRDQGTGTDVQAKKALATRVADIEWREKDVNDNPHKYRNPFTGVMINDPVYCGKNTALNALRQLATPGEVGEALRKADKNGGAEQKIWAREQPEFNVK